MTALAPLELPATTAGTTEETAHKWSLPVAALAKALDFFRCLQTALRRYGITRLNDFLPHVSTVCMEQTRAISPPHPVSVLTAPLVGCTRHGAWNSGARANGACHLFSRTAQITQKTRSV